MVNVHYYYHRRRSSTFQVTELYHVSAQGVDERMVNVHYYYHRRRSSTFQVTELSRGGGFDGCCRKTRTVPIVSMAMPASTCREQFNSVWTATLDALGEDDRKRGKGGGGGRRRGGNCGGNGCMEEDEGVSGSEKVSTTKVISGAARKTQCLVLNCGECLVSCCPREWAQHCGVALRLECFWLVFLPNPSSLSCSAYAT